MFAQSKCSVDPGSMTTLAVSVGQGVDEVKEVPTNLITYVKELYQNLCDKKHPEANQALHQLIAHVIDPQQVIDKKLKNWVKGFFQQDGKMHPHVRAIILNAAEADIRVVEIADTDSVAIVQCVSLPTFTRSRL